MKPPTKTQKKREKNQTTTPQTFIPRKISLEIYNIQIDKTIQNFYVLTIKNTDNLVDSIKKDKYFCQFLIIKSSLLCP